MLGITIGVRAGMTGERTDRGGVTCPIRWGTIGLPGNLEMLMG